MKVHTKPTTCDVAVLSCPDFSSLMKLKERVEVGLGGLVSALEIMDRRVLELVRERTSTSVPWEVRVLQIARSQIVQSTYCSNLVARLPLLRPR